MRQQNKQDRFNIVLPLHQTPPKRCRGVEPLPYFSRVVLLLMFAVTILKLVSLLGFEPRPHGPKPRMQPDNTLER